MIGARYVISFVLPATFFLTTHGTAYAQGRSADEQAIRRLIQAHAVAWDSSDAKAAAAVFAPDAVWVTSSGRRLVGRPEIERAHAQWFADGLFTGGSTEIPPEALAIRVLRPDVAVADFQWVYLGGKRPDGKPIPPSRGNMFIVVTRESGKWLIAELRHTPTPQQ